MKWRTIIFGGLGLGVSVSFGVFAILYMDDLMNDVTSGPPQYVDTGYYQNNSMVLRAMVVLGDGYHPGNLEVLVDGEPVRFVHGGGHPGVIEPGDFIIVDGFYPCAQHMVQVVYVEPGSWSKTLFIGPRPATSMVCDSDAWALLDGIVPNDMEAPDA